MCLYPWQLSSRFAPLGFQLRILLSLGVKVNLCVGDIVHLLRWFWLSANLASVGETILICLGWCKDHIAAFDIVLRNGKYEGLLINISPALGLLVGNADEGAIMLLGYGFDLIFNAWRRRESRASMRGVRDRPWGFRVQRV